MYHKQYMTCGACEGEGYHLRPVPVQDHEDHMDYTAADELALCGYCRDAKCEYCHGTGQVLVQALG